MPYKPGHMPETAWKPGQSGNPAGRPPGIKSFKQRILEMSEREITLEDIDGKLAKTTLGEAVTMALYGKAVHKKDLNAIRMVMDHTEDKALTLKGDKENPLEINNTVDASRAIQQILGLAAQARASCRTFEDELADESPS